MDAIIIADSGSESVSATTSLKLTIDNHIASLQAIKNFLQNNGRIVAPISGEGTSSWTSCLKYNGLYLFSYLSGQGFDVELIDSYYNEKDKFIKLLKQSPKAIVISTSFIMNKKTLNNLARDIKSLAPSIYIIAGGQFVHLSNNIKERSLSKNPILDVYREEYIFLDLNEEPPVDLYIISPRGEDVLACALRKLIDKEKLDDLPNTARYENKKYSFSRKTTNTLSTCGITVDWKRMPNEFFKSGVVPVQASYGCPFNCAFCNFMKDRRLMGVKPIDQLIQEIHMIEERGAKYIWFVDDNFRLGKNDLREVCEQFIAHGINIKWKSFIRVSALKNIDMKLLKEAGCIEVQFGLESADPTILAAMNKKSNPKLYADVIERVMKAGINCSCYFIFGFPGETEETVMRTREFIKSLEHPELDGYIYFTLFPFIIAPLSPISELINASKYGLSGHMYTWKHNTMNSKRAMEHATRAFFELKTSGIIYHNDNLDMLLDLKPKIRKEFIAGRHKAAKAVAQGSLQRENILGYLKSIIPEFITYCNYEERTPDQF
jgi:anaerobic magnesium-protoporphyrin IX monomethyl ester cyclase